MTRRSRWLLGVLSLAGCAALQAGDAASAERATHRRRFQAHPAEGRGEAGVPRIAHAEEGSAAVADGERRYVYADPTAAGSSLYVGGEEQYQRFRRQEQMAVDKLLAGDGSETRWTGVCGTSRRADRARRLRGEWLDRRGDRLCPLPKGWFRSRYEIAGRHTLYSVWSTRLRSMRDAWAVAGRHHQCSPGPRSPAAKRTYLILGHRRDRSRPPCTGSAVTGSPPRPANAVSSAPSAYESFPCHLAFSRNGLRATAPGARATSQPPPRAFTSSTLASCAGGGCRCRALVGERRGLRGDHLQVACRRRPGSGW